MAEVEKKQQVAETNWNGANDDVSVDDDAQKLAGRFSQCVRALLLRRILSFIGWWGPVSVREGERLPER